MSSGNKILKQEGNKMTVKEMKNIQAAARALNDIVRINLDCEPYEAPDYIHDVYYGANTLWLKLQKMIEKEESK